MPLLSYCHAKKSSDGLDGNLIFKICCASFVLKKSLTTSSRYSILDSSISWDTHFNRHGRLFPVGLLDHPRQIQGSRHMRIEVSAPIRQHTPFLTNSSPFTIAFHVGDWLDGNDVSKRFLLGEYFAFSTQAHRLSNHSTSLHACQARRASLKSFRS